MDYIEHLERLKQHKKIVDYRIDGNNVYVSPVVPIDHIEVKFKVSSDGDAMVSTGQRVTEWTARQE